MIADERKKYLLEKKAFLYRKAHGKLLANSYTRKIKYLTSDEASWSFLSLNETDDLIGKMSRLKKSINKTTINPIDLPQVIRRIKKLSFPCCLLIDEDWRYCGAIKIDSSSILNPNFRFGEIIENDVCVIEENVEKRIDLDFYERGGLFKIDVSVIKFSKTGRL